MIYKALHEKILPALKNKYVATLIVFFVWMLFFDRNDLVSRIRLQKQLNKLKKEKKFYLDELQKIHHTHELLFSTDEALEKFAREKYLMKRPDEELFLIVKKKD
ncbi:MAG: hypothetical protein KatS3mg031_1692 [Chitinophagales bacterium]|nr:MAG: hypothetical protein KatS3mg031_1692 [Chitinophagales bacterium]